MHKRTLIYLIATVSLLVGNLPNSLAVNKPNAPASVSVSSATTVGTTNPNASINVTWSKPVVDSTHPIPIYYIVKATAIGETSYENTVTPLNVVTTSSFSHVASGLKGGVQYSIIVESHDFNDQVTASSEMKFTTQSLPEDPIPVSAVPGVNQVTLNWTAPANAGGSSITKYVITESAISNIEITDMSKTSHVVTGLTSGQSYTFSISATNSIGTSAGSNFSLAKVPSTPGKPTSVTLTSGTTSLSSTWLAPTSTGDSTITGYKVFLYDSGGVNQVGTTKETTSTNYEFTGVAAGTYVVKIKSKNIVGDSVFSDASAQAVIDPPSGLTDNTPVFTPSILPDLVLGRTQSVSATVPSGGTVTISVTGNPSGACTYSAGVVTAVAVGICSVNASSPSTSTFARADSTKTFSVTKSVQTITFSSLLTQEYPGSLSVTATSDANLVVSFTVLGNCTISGRTITFTSIGSCTVTASQSGNSTFGAATNVRRTFDIILGSGSNSNNGSNSNGAGGGGGIGPTPVVGPDDEKLPITKPSPKASPKTNGKASQKPVTNSAAKTSVKTVGNLSVLTLAGNTAKVEIRDTYNFQVALPIIKKGQIIRISYTDSKGKVRQVSATRMGDSGAYTGPYVKFPKVGTYKLLIKVGNVSRFVTVKVSK